MITLSSVPSTAVAADSLLDRVKEETTDQASGDAPVDSQDRSGSLTTQSLIDLKKEGVFTIGLVIGSIAFASSEWGQSFWEVHVASRFTDAQLLGPVLYVHTVLVFVVLAGLYSLLDLMHWPRSLYRYKTQPTKTTTFDAWLKGLSLSLINMVLVNIPVAYLFVQIAPLAGITAATPLPSPLTMARDYVIFAITAEIFTYYPHRLLHTPHLYQRIHKSHHEFPSPNATATMHAHPIEHLIVTTPIFFGPLLCGSHYVTTVAWVTAAIGNTVMTHSGFAIPYLASPLHHDLHHRAFNVNYGATGFLDRLHGTDRGMREFVDAFNRRVGGAGLNVEAVAGAERGDAAVGKKRL